MSGAAPISEVNSTPPTPVKSILRKDASSSALRSPKGSPKGRRISWCVEVREESRNSTRALSSVRDCIQFLKEGTVLLKIRGHKVMERYMFFSEPKQALCWESKRTTIRSIPVADLRAVNVGKHTKTLTLTDNEEFEPERCFTIIHGHGKKDEELDLVASNAEDATLWIYGLRQLITQHARPADLGDGLYRSTVVGSMADGESIDKETAVAISKRLQPQLHPSYITAKFANDRERNKAEDGTISETMRRDEFVDFYVGMASRRELYLFMRQYGDESGAMDAEALQRFLELEQQEIQASVEYCQETISEFSLGDDKTKFGLDGFTNFMLSMTDLVSDEKQEGSTLDQPLNRYFVATSHNTWLEAGQTVGPVSADQYATVLREGARCVEMHVWNGKDGEPIVQHMYTKTKSIPFVDCLEAIHEAAFAVTSYPLIVHLEMHCGEDQQKICATLLQRVFGDALTTLPDATPLPSPETLRNKIILMGLKLPPEVEEAGGTVQLWEANEALPLKPKVVKKGRSGKRIPTDGENATPAESWLELCPELSKLVSIAVLKYEGPSAAADARTMRSISEEAAEEALRSDELANQQVKLAQASFVRIYPSSKNVDSDNIPPVPLLCLGAQFVPMNYQLRDINYHVYLGWFRQNGCAGYVEKPATLCDVSAANPYDEHTSAVPGQALSITIISGQQLVVPGEYYAEIVDPYIVVGITGKQIDCVERATRAIDNNAFCPYWQETFEFQVQCPDVAMFYVIALDDTVHRESQLGQFACPVRSLRPGYRHIQLHRGEGGLKQGASLFVKIEFVDIINVAETETMKRGGSRRVKRSITEFQETGIPMADSQFKAFSADFQKGLALNTEVSKAIKTLAANVGAKNKMSLVDAVDAMLALMRKADVHFTLSGVGDVVKIALEEDEDTPQNIRNYHQMYCEVVTRVSDLLRVAPGLVLSMDSMLDKLRTVDAQQQVLVEAIGMTPAAGKKASRAMKNNFLKIERAPHNLRTSVETLKEEFAVIKTMVVISRRTSVMY